MPVRKKNQDTDWLDGLESQISETKQSKELDGLESQISETKQSKERTCIYAVPETLIKTNGKDVYRPRLVSIGPHHYSDDQVQVMKKHKLEFLMLLLKRKKDLDFKDLMESIRPLAPEARKCYSKEINLESFNDDDRFLKMMVVDGCFLIELFLKAADKHKLLEFNTIYGDLLLLENQIPFSVLENLFQTYKKYPNASETSKMREEYSDASLSLLALRFFNKVMQRRDGVIEKFLKKPTPNDEKLPLHLLDLVRSSLLLHEPDQEETRKAISNSEPSNQPDQEETRIPISNSEPSNQPDQEETRIPISNSAPSNKRNDLIYCISKLRRAGIKDQLIEADSFLDVKFRKGIFGNGVIQMPNITMNNHMKCFLVNCVAFEQLHSTPSKQFTVYARLLDCLVNTAKDVEHLCLDEIFDNYFGKDGDIAQFINKMGKDLAFDENQFYLSQLFKDVNDCYGTTWKVQLARFQARYFDSPWSFMSVLAAIVLLLLTLLQTFYTVYAYYVKSKA
ncbi:UPF0481 protein At3g47200-like [Corylus avellana]|uniref:UPF0481 protein At3g47200-like n=1 Tax=Corylus avellana TaxID=13451 RepID=UPI00286B8A51|nr:UPF0481 protein At3g47200-like [Corylus avellana]